MKIMITIITLLYTLYSSAQQPLDTIYANEHKNVALFFPEPIRQGITGSSNFVFTYNREKEQYFGLLQAKPGDLSNLFVVTNTGEVYSYILKYATKLPQLNYFVSIKESIGNEKSKPKEKPDFVFKEKQHIAKNEFQNICERLVLKGLQKRVRTKNTYGIKLSLNKIVYKNDALFFILEIKNTSRIDYEINYLKFFTANRTGSRRKSFQKLLKEPIYNYHQPMRVVGNSTQKFVLVFTKFTIDRTKKMVIELNELHGERNLELHIPSRRLMTKLSE